MVVYMLPPALLSSLPFSQVPARSEGNPDIFELLLLFLEHSQKKIAAIYNPTESHFSKGTNPLESGKDIPPLFPPFRQGREGASVQAPGLICLSPLLGPL